jgi:hypothetical protein
MIAKTRSRIAAYAAAGAITLLFQVWIRLQQCEGAAKCGLSLAKAVIWSFVWPAYWVVYIAGFTGLVSPSPPAAFSITTQRYDNARTGQNLSERVLNISNVNQASFGKLFIRSVDDEIHAQPLYVPDLEIPSAGVHNVLFVATANNTIYAFDADDLAAAAPLWRVNLHDREPKARPVKASDVGQRCGHYRDFAENIGIVGTPVIDLATQTLFVVARSKESGGFVQRLHALDIATGAERPHSPVVVAASVPGTGAGSTKGMISFNPANGNQRGSLLLANDTVYITWASHCDTAPYHGWIIGYDRKTLAQRFAKSVTPNGEAGGIWQSNSGPSADASGTLYLSVGNGTVTAPDGGTDYGNAFLKLDPAAAVLDWFIPHDTETLSAADLDVGSTGVLLIPNTLLIAGGSKSGKLYMLDRDHLGHYKPDSDDQIVQSFKVAPDGIWGTPTYWDGPDGPYVYVWGSLDHGKAFRLHEGLLEAASETAEQSKGRPGGVLSISAHGAKAGTGILWAVLGLGNANNAAAHAILTAYDAADLSHALWNSDQNAARDGLGNLAKFNTPVVANGKVYMATSSRQVVVYGLLPEGQK